MRLKKFGGGIKIIQIFDFFLVAAAAAVELFLPQPHRVVKRVFGRVYRGVFPRNRKILLYAALSLCFCSLDFLGSFGPLHDVIY